MFKTDKEQQDKLKEYNRQKSKAWYEKNKEYKKQYCRDYYEDNKEELIRRKMEYYEDNKQRIKQHQEQVIICEICGSQIRWDGLNRHQLTIKCKKAGKENQKKPI